MKRFLTGLATGLAISYLTAPRSGKEIRKQLTDKTNEQSKNLKKQWTKTATQVKKLADDVQSGSESKPNLFAEMEAGRYDRFLMEEKDAAVRK